RRDMPRNVLTRNCSTAYPPKGGENRPPQLTSPGMAAAGTHGENDMTTRSRVRDVLCAAGLAAVLGLGAPAAHADGNLSNVKHIIIVMQENHSYDNYFGVLGYVPNSPFHNAKRSKGCDPSDHACVDGLKCKAAAKTGVLTCKNKNPSNF